MRKLEELPMKDQEELVIIAVKIISGELTQEQGQKLVDEITKRNTQ